MEESLEKHPDFKDYENFIVAMEKIILAASSSFDLDSLLQEIIKILVEFSNSDRGAFFIIDEKTQDLVMRAARNYDPKLRFNARYDTNHPFKTLENIGLTVFAYLRNETVFLNSKDEIITHPAYLGKFVDKDKYIETDCSSLLCIPLGVEQKKPIGILKIENTLDVQPPKAFSINVVKYLNKLAATISKAIINFSNQIVKVDTSINKILSTALTSSHPDKLVAKLRKVAKTFQEISHAEGVTIWLIEGEEEAKLICKAVSGKYYKNLEGQSYNLSYDLNKVKNIGLTPYIALSGETINIKTHEEIISHPQYKGTYNEILDPDGIDKCKSFIGTPLKIGEKIIGVIKADSRIGDENHPDSFFTTEEAQIFSYLSIITSIIIDNEREFERTKRRDRQLLTLYQLGTECYQLNNHKSILSYLLTGLTHGEGIAYNRAIIFKFIEEINSPCLIGLKGLGARSKKQGKSIQRHFKNGNIPIIENSKKIMKNEVISPTPDLENFIRNKKLFLYKQCALYSFIKEAIYIGTSKTQLIHLNKCSSNVQEMLRELETLNEKFLVFSIPTTDNQIFIGICDNVYSNLTQHDEFTVRATEIFIGQISLALSRLSLKKTQEELTEEAWQEFTSITAHRIGTETAIMSGALNFFKKSFPSDTYNNEYNNHWKQDIEVLEKSLNNLKRAVRDYTELQKPPEIKFKPIQISQILNSVKEDAETLQFNIDIDDKVSIINEYSEDFPIIHGDYDLLSYAFKEIYDNAITAMPNGGQLTTSVSRNENILDIIIEDTGTGIKPENLSKVFNRGFRDRAGGTGLGLYIVKRNIELHEGTIHVENNRERGTTFYVTLPILKLSPNRIMIIEDHEIHLEFLVRSIKLKNPNIAIDIARNEIEAIKLLDETLDTNKNNSYDYIIADVNLEEKGGSELGGIKFLEYIFDNQKKSLKVIILVAHSGMIYWESSGRKKSILDKVKELGAYACLSRNQERNYLDELNEIIYT